jgi:membrane protease YdiL (CAAX protease family)
MRDTQDRLSPTTPSLISFFGLVIVLTIPFWVIGALVDVQVLPGIHVSALMFVTPGLAAAILTYRSSGAAGVAALIRRCVDIQRIRPVTWFVPILLLHPAALVLSFWIMERLGLPLPADPSVAWSMIPILVIIFFISGSFEQAGWMGYAFEPLQQRFQALPAALILGAFWAVWHYIPLVQGGRAIGWIAWWTVATVAIRVIMAWLFNNTEHSVFATILFQVVLNTGMAIFPNQGSHYNPMVTGLVLTVIAAVVVAIYGPRTLARPRIT